MKSLKLDLFFILITIITVNLIPIYSVEWKHGLPYNVTIGLVLVILYTILGFIFYLGRAIYLVGFQIEYTHNMRRLISISYAHLRPYIVVIVISIVLQSMLFIWTIIKLEILLWLTAIVLAIIATLADIVVLPCILYKVIDLGYCYKSLDTIKASLAIGVPGMVINFILGFLYANFIGSPYYPYIWPLSDDAVDMFSEGHEPWFPSIPSIIATLVYARFIAFIKDIR